MNNQIQNIKMIMTTKSTISMQVINPRVIKIAPVDQKCENVVDNNIVALCYDEIQIKKGEVLKIGKQKYRIKSIVKDLQGAQGAGYYLYTHETITKTTSFIMPFLGSNRNSYRYSMNFVNAFVGSDTDDAEYGDYIYLLYRFDGSMAYVKFDEAIRKHPYFENVVEPDLYHTLYKLKLPEKYREDIDLILLGKYSRITTESKQKILNFHLTTQDRPLGEILMRSPNKRIQMEKEFKHPIPEENELLSPFEILKEIYTNDFIIN